MEKGQKVSNTCVGRLTSASENMMFSWEKQDPGYIKLGNVMDAEPEKYFYGLCDADKHLTKTECYVNYQTQRTLLNSDDPDYPVGYCNYFLNLIFKWKKN